MFPLKRRSTASARVYGGAERPRPAPSAKHAQLQLREQVEINLLSVECEPERVFSVLRICERDVEIIKQPHERGAGHGPGS